MSSVKKTKLSLYGYTFKTITAGELAAQDDVIARAEDSGCEGCYVEVARWHVPTTSWRRYAFVKLWGDDDHTDKEVADAVAGVINGLGGGYLSLIHDLDNYEEGGRDG